MKATEITRTTIVRFEMDAFTDANDHHTQCKATVEAERVLMAEGQPHQGEWVETRFMPMGFVEVEYRTVLGLDKD